MHRSAVLLTGLLLSPAILFSQTLFKPLPAAQTHIDFSNTINENEGLNVLAYEYFYNGGGVAVGDINNDGLDDLFFTANQKPNKLYLNLGGLSFKDISASAGVEGRTGAWKTGVSMADVNGDGLLDIYVCYSGKVDEALRRNQLFINKGNLVFEEQAARYGLDHPGYSTQAAFFDVDHDGDLDCFLLNHNVKKYDNMELARLHKETDELAGNRLLENRDGHFTDISQKAGIYQYPLTFGLGLAIADINQDGWLDIYVTNDYNEPDYLYLNNGNGTFREDSQHCFRHLAQFSMGIDIADYNNDGLPDILSLDMLPEDNRRQKLLQLQENYESFELMTRQGLYRQYMRNMLQLNNGDGTFSEIGQLAGVSNTDWSWSPLLADFDNDGFKDLFITNGYLRDYTNKDFLKYWGDYKVRKAMNRESVQLMDLVLAMPSTKLANYIFRNNHDLTFQNKQADWGIQTPTMSNGAVYADLDNDGDLELVVNNINEPASVYQNMSREMHTSAYLGLRLAGKATAIGAKVTVYADGIRQYQEVVPVRGYLSCQSQVLHFGLGKAKQIDSLIIAWPGRQVQKLTAVSINQLLTVKEENGTAPTPFRPVAGLFRKTPSPLLLTHQGYNENDFKRQPLMLFMYSQTGPVLAKGDLNHDGLEDVFVSGDQQRAGGVWLQQKNGSFRLLDGMPIGDESMSAVSAALFFDLNGDGWDDLYIAKGGYSLFEPQTASLQDELFLNDGAGRLTKAPLPDLSAGSKSCVRVCDFDNDGDPDLFVGGRVVPGKYPLAPTSYLLENNGEGRFKPLSVPFSNIGMVTDAHWEDIDGDGRKDLLLCGEFMPVKLYLNTREGFLDKTSRYFPKEDNGLWFSLAVGDVDGDGQKDLIAGNFGTNSQIRASEKEPAELYFADFDKNGSIDPFFNFYIQGKSYPFVSRDELNDQMYSMRKKFGFYKDYADAQMKNLFTPAELDKTQKLTATELRSVCYLRKKDHFEKRVLPLEAQFAPVTNTLIGDVDKDGKADLLLFGNKSDNRLKIGSIDAGYGTLLKGHGDGSFTYVRQPESGLSVTGDVKSVLELATRAGTLLLIGAFNEPLQCYRKP